MASTPPWSQEGEHAEATITHSLLQTWLNLCRATLVQPNLLDTTEMFNSTTLARFDWCRANKKAKGTWRAGLTSRTDPQNIKMYLQHNGHRKLTTICTKDHINLPRGWSSTAKTHMVSVQNHQLLLLSKPAYWLGTCFCLGREQAVQWPQYLPMLTLTPKLF